MKRTVRSRLKAIAIVLLLSGTLLAATGCYDDPHYYGRRGVRTGYYASYGAPGPYYGYDPYYGGGYGPGVGVSVSSYRSNRGYYRRPYYPRDYYGRSGYYHRGAQRRDWDRRRDGDDRRRWERRARRDRNRATTREAAPDQQPEAETQ